LNLATMQFTSVALGKIVSYIAILPEGKPGPYPVLVQLHGYGDDHTAWLNYSNLFRYAQDYNMIVVLPDGGTSFYLNLYTNDDPTNSVGLQRYESFIMRDLMKHVSATFPVKPGRWAIGGLSMGGYGAMRLGCKYPDKFASIWAHSGVYWSRREMEDQIPNPDDADIYAITEALAKRAETVAITFDCGVEDDLLLHNRRLHAHMEVIGLAHTYTEHPGGHTWDYWDLHVREALAQHAAVLGESTE
jgi:putative tributyrin esterase